ncbi:MAG: LysM peptidoglycan-binding domain-containing protein [Steroidobacteraceae bacterium]
MKRILGLLAALALSACATMREPAPPAPTPVPTSPAVVETPAPPLVAPPPEVPVTVAGITPEKYADLFDRIRAGYQLPDVESEAIDREFRWYANNPEYLDRVFGRAGPYLYHIVGEIEARQMPLELALLPVVESAFEPYAYSRARASGLWQFIPPTGSRFGLKQDWWYDGRRDVIESTRAALDYLQFLHDEFDDWLLAVAAYNCGEANVARAMRASAAAGHDTDFFSIRSRLPKETRAYVPKLLAMARLFLSPEDYGIEFSSVPNEPYFVSVDTLGQIDMKLAADLAGISYDELYTLNPAFHRWATDPSGPHRLLVPADTADLFRESVQQLTPDERMRVIHHRVRAGDTVAEIAREYHTQTHVIRELNDLRPNDRLAVGDDLRVPSGVTELPAKVQLAALRVDRGVRGGPARGGVHVVRRGDTLSAIARRNRIDVRTLAALNHMGVNDTIRAGQRLVVSKSAASSASSTHNSRGSASGSAGGSYTVRSGDTLWAIARRFGITVSQIVAWNGISAQEAIKPGQKLTVKKRG